MAKSRYKSMSDDELRALSKEKNKKTGSFKQTALAAQKELWERTHWDVTDPFVADDYTDRSIEDVQYNG